MRIRIEQATVYKAPNGRRYLTEKYAYFAAARMMIRVKYWSEDAHCYGDESFAGIDLDPNYEHRLTKSLARYLRWLDDREMSDH